MVSSPPSSCSRSSISPTRNSPRNTAASARPASRSTPHFPTVPGSPSAGQVGRCRRRELSLAPAYDHGVEFLRQRAETYNAGEAKRLMGDASSPDLRLLRDAYTVSSKVYFGASEQPKPTQRGLSRKHVFDACHQALERLRVRLPRHAASVTVPIPIRLVEESRPGDWIPWIRQGKVMYWGTSEWPAAAIVKGRASRGARAVPHRAIDGAAFSTTCCTASGSSGNTPRCTSVTAWALCTVWSPLAFGLLTGKCNDGVPDDSRLGPSRLRPVAPRPCWRDDGACA